MSVLINQENLYPTKKKVTKIVGKRKKKRKKKKVTKTIKVTKLISAEGQKIKTLRHLYATKEGAESGARAAFKKIKRGLAEFKINLAIGQPDLYSETPINVTGFKAKIDAESWILSRITRSLNDGDLLHRWSWKCCLLMNKQISQLISHNLSILLQDYG